MSMHAEKLHAISDDGRSDVKPLCARLNDIVVLATSSDPWSPAVTAGISLTARWGGNLTSCYIEPSLRMVGGADMEPSVLGLLLQPHGEGGGERAAFAFHAHRFGVREAAWTVSHCGLVPTLRQLGAWHDLAVLERDMVEGAHVFDILGEALLGSYMPCLVLPPQWDKEVALDHVAVCWNGSIEGARAIHGALPFLQAAGEVILIDGEKHTLDDTESSLPRLDPLSYLLRHKVAAKVRHIHAPPHLAGEALLQEARNMHANLLVMGAYGHSRLHERVLRGATRHILGHAHIPILMQH
ncbi:MAG TPA: universal stress protein [Rhodanobacter sp.]|nr:universal stress protein [Rhodanobacter sp.]